MRRTRNLNVRTLALGAVGLCATGAFAQTYFNPRVVAPAFGTAPAVAIANIDGLGGADAVAVSPGKVAWARNEGGSPPTFTDLSISVALALPTGVAVANIGGSAALDVIVSDSGANKISWFEQGPGSPPVWTERIASSAVPGAAGVIVADIDGDTDPDFVAAAVTANTIYWFESNGASPPAFTRRTVSSLAVGCSSVAAADLNGDGRTDVVGYNSEVPALLWFENTATADGAPEAITWVQRIVGGAPTANGRVCAADLNGDARPDVILATPTGLRWFRNNTANPGMFTPALFTFNLAGPSGVCAANVNGDSRLDIVVSFGAGKGVAWYENDGQTIPEFIERVIEANTTGHASVAAGDLDADGDTDILAGDSEVAVLHWYEQGEPDINIGWSTVDGGGGSSAATGSPPDGAEPLFVVNGTIGQHDASASASGAFEVRGGFWLTPLDAPCPGDANGDDVVDFLDLNLVLSDFGQAGPGLAGDVNHDGVCDFIDLNIVLGAFGTSC